MGYKPTATYINTKSVINTVAVKTAYKYRAYPSKAQKETLDKQMFIAKELYNILLERSKAYYKETGKTLTEYRMNIWITQMKKERPEFSELHSQVLQNVSRRVSDAYRHFFRRCREKKQGKKVKVGFPRYKKFVSSLTYPQANGFRIEKKRVELSKAGRINFVNHRDIEGKPKTCTIKKTKSGEWYITISVEKEAMGFASNNKPQIGLDLGLREYATLSDNTKIPNLRFGKQSRKKAKRLQQRISRKQKGSVNRHKAVLKFARLSESIANRRNDFAHKLSISLVRSYSFIAYEDLQVQNMAKNHHYAKSINDVSWSRFTQFLCYKAESAGCRVVDVPPQYTTQTCNECRNIQEVEKGATVYICGRCGLQIDRDLNASINILRIGLEKSSTTEGHSGSQASGDDVRPSAREAVADESGTIWVAS
jgi:putative transposase